MTDNDTDDERFAVAVTLEGDLRWWSQEGGYAEPAVEVAGAYLTGVIEALAKARGAPEGKRIRARIRIELADGPEPDGT